MKLNFLFALMFCSWSVIGQIDLEHNISDAEKLYGLSSFWSEANYNFAFFDQTDVNWDSTYQAFIPKVLATENTFEYYRTMQQFCALLKDGHTNVYLPDSLYKTSTYTHIRLEFIQGKVYVANVVESDADKLPIGSELLKVNDLEAKAYFEKEVIPYISASTQHQLWNDAVRRYYYPLRDTIERLQMEFKTPDGKMVSYKTGLHASRSGWAKPYPDWKRFEMESLDGGIAHLKINTFGDDSVVVDFKNHLPEIYKSKAVIIDLRNNGGGSSSTGGEILSYFTDQKLLGSTWRTREHLGAYKAWGKWLASEELSDEEKEDDWVIKSINVYNGDHWYVGDTMSFDTDPSTQKMDVPLVVLVSNNTASAAEDFLIFLDGLKGRATTIGQYTYGSTGQPLPLDLPGGGSARICSKRDTYPDGREFVGYGVKPDIFVERTVGELISGEDLVLEKALQVLADKMD